MRSALCAAISVLALATATWSAPARAACTPAPQAPARPKDPAQADRLFTEAKQLLKDNKVSEACRKLEASEELDPTGGTLLQLAYCLELEGKLSSSYARYMEAQELAQREKNDRRADLAREHLTAIAPRLHKLQILVSPAARSQPGLEIQLDGVCIEASAWDKAVPVDPGHHEINAAATGAKPLQIGVDLEQEGSTTTVVIPSLEVPVVVAPPPPPPPPPPQPAPPPPQGSSTPGIVLTSLGAASLVIGAVTGGLTLSAAHDIKAKCGPGGSCPLSQQGPAQRAGALATVSTAGSIAGGVLVAGGVVLWVTRPFGRGTTAVRVSPGSIRVEGTF